MTDRTELMVSDPPAVRALRENLARQAARFENVLPSVMTPEELFSVAVGAVMKTPLLLQCSQESLVNSLMQAARLGLRPDGLLSEGWLIPRYNRHTKGYEASFQTGYRGLEMLMRRAGARKIVTRLVYEGEPFSVAYGFDERIDHVPMMGPEFDRSDERVTHAYAWMTDVNGEHSFEVMTKAELDTVRDQHGARNRDGKLTGPWVSDPGEMRRKTVLRRLAKHSELSTEAKEVLGSEDASEPIEATVEPVTKAAPRRIGTKRLREKLEAAKKEESDAEEAIGEETPEPAGEEDGSGQADGAADEPKEEDQPAVKTEADPLTPDGEPIAEAEALEGEYTEATEHTPTDEEILAVTGGEFIEEPATEATDEAAPEGDLEGEVSPGIYIGRVSFPAAGEKYDGQLKTYPDGKKRTYFGLAWPGGELLIVAVAELAEELFKGGKFTLHAGQRVKINGKAYKPTTGAFKGRQLIAVETMETLEL